MIFRSKKSQYQLVVDHIKSNWLKYGFETFVVINGILIAFFLNGWNEQRKEARLEVKILAEIQSNLVHDLEEIQEDISLMDTINWGCAKIHAIIKNPDSKAEDLRKPAMLLRVNPHFDPVKSGYSLLISSGVEIIKDDSVRENLYRLYESTYSYYYRYEEERTHFKELSIDPLVFDYFVLNFDPTISTWLGEYHISPDDFIRFKNDHRVPKIVSGVSFNNSLVQNRAYRVKREIDELQQQIDQYLAGKSR